MLKANGRRTPSDSKGSLCLRQGELKMKSLKKNQILVISYDNFISPFHHIQSTFLHPPFQNIIHNQENLKIYTIPSVQHVFLQCFHGCLYTVHPKP
jgi:hypothetical protein